MGTQSLMRIRVMQGLVVMVTCSTTMIVNKFGPSLSNHEQLATSLMPLLIAETWLLDSGNHFVDVHSEDALV